MVTWKGVEIADKGFLINLKGRKDRLEQSLDELNKNEIVGVERFDAIKIDEDTELGWKIRGCTHSHMEILKQQKIEGWKRVLILEDDFVFDVCSEHDYEFGRDEIKKIQSSDFDLLFLGATLLEKSDYYNSFLIKPNMFVQTTAYISSLKLSEFVVDNFNYLNKNSIVSGEQIDSFYSTLACKSHWRMNHKFKDSDIILNNNLNIFFHFPVLFNQRESFSDILNRNIFYGDYNRKNNLKNYPK